jgi:ligand-binding sensor domain-containing protein
MKEIIRFRLINTVILLLGLFLFSRAQTSGGSHSQQDFRMVNWNSEQGLYYGRVNCFLKDKNGFLWVGTERGLNRFDGLLFKNYLNLFGGNQTTIDFYILSLVEDSLHNIWVGTSKGISRYDIQADSFTHFLPGNVFDQPMIPFWATADLVYCVESDSLITTYDIRTQQRKKIGLLPNRTGAWYINTQSVLEPKSKCIWMVTNDREGGLLRISLSDGKQQRFNWPSFLKIPNSSHFTESMVYDKKRNAIWLNDMEGLIEFTLADHQFHYVDCLKNIFNRAAGIGLDPEGRVWVGTSL